MPTGHASDGEAGSANTRRRRRGAFLADTSVHLPLFNRARTPPASQRTDDAIKQAQTARSARCSFSLRKTEARDLFPRRFPPPCGPAERCWRLKSRFDRGDRRALASR